jgi:hypothetical protein
LTVHLKALEQREANTPKRNRPQEKKSNSAEINQVETKGTRQRICWFFEKIDKIDKPLARLTRGLINKIRNEKETEQQILKKSKTPSDPSTNGYTQQNWKTWMKWTIF